MYSYKTGLIITGFFGVLLDGISDDEYKLEYECYGDVLINKNEKVPINELSCYINSYEHKSNSYLRYIYSSYKEDKTNDILNSLYRDCLINFRYNKVEPYLKYEYYLLSNHIEFPYCLDLDSLVMDYLLLNKHLLLINNRRDVFKYIFDKLSSIIEDISPDIVLYSTQSYKMIKDDTKNNILFNYNFSILSWLNKKTHLVIGGGLIYNKRFNKFINKSKFTVFNGRDVSDIDFNKSSVQSTNKDIPLYKFCFNKNIKLIHDTRTDKKFIEVLLGVKLPKEIPDSYGINEIVFKTSIYDCFGKCAFCGSGYKKENKYEPQLYSKTTEDKVLELKDMVEYFNLNSLLLLDGYITHNTLDIFIKHDLHINSTVGVRIKDVDEEYCKKLCHIGVRIANIGIETYNDNHLKYVGKDITCNDIDNSINILHNHGILLNCNFIIGMPGAPKDEFIAINNFIQKFGDNIFNSMRLSMFQLLPQSRFCSNPQKYGLNVINYSNDLPHYVERNGNTMQNIQTPLMHKMYNHFNFGVGRYYLSNHGIYLNLLMLLISYYNSKDKAWNIYKNIVDSYNN